MEWHNEHAYLQQILYFYGHRSGVALVIRVYTTNTYVIYSAALVRLYRMYRCPVSNCLCIFAVRKYK